MSKIFRFIRMISFRPKREGYFDTCEQREARTERKPALTRQLSNLLGRSIAKRVTGWVLLDSP